MYNNHDYLNKLYHQHRHMEMVGRAERKRLISQLRAGHPAAVRFYQPALAALGHWLVLSGTYLQKKSGALAEQKPIIQPSARGL